MVQPGRCLTLEDLRARRTTILRLATARGTHNVRVFGSVAHGEARVGGDVDFLVDFEPGRSVLDLSELILDLQEALGVDVDVLDARRAGPQGSHLRRAAVPPVIDGRDHRLLEYVRHSISLIQARTHGGRNAFLDDVDVQHAVLWRLETLVEATGWLSPDIKSRHPQIRWRAVYGFRNIAAHGYLDLRLDLVWETVADHLPTLAAAIQRELDQVNAE